MRRVVPSTGKPYPRKRPINWAFVKEVLKTRRERQRMTNAGFVQHGIVEPQNAAHRGLKVVDAVPSEDGQSVFLRIVDENGQPAG
jgi:hypothetical protein